MKSKLVVFLMILAAFLAVLGAVSCKSPPPPPPPPPPARPVPPPPPPPPPPEPEEEPQPEPEPEPEADTEGPEITVVFSSEYFSPDGDGVEDELIVNIDVWDASPIAGWHIEIREPASNLLFSEWSGEGVPPSTIAWDGRSTSGELVQSASDYPFSLSVSDIHGNISIYNGTIQVDVLVMREPGDVLRVIVPSIVFPANSDSLSKGLKTVDLERNKWILGRIAEVLNKFYTYKVTVEGHANLTAATERARRTEQDREAKPLSQKRAQAVVDYLVDLGVERPRLTAVGIGGSRPVAQYEDHDNWWKNRRVEFLLQK